MDIKIHCLTVLCTVLCVLVGFAMGIYHKI